MLLHTPFYLLFLGLVVALYWWLPNEAWRKRFLVVVSALFYTLFDWRFSLLLAILVLFTHIVATCARRPYGRWLYIIHLFFALGLLGWFKYAGFFLDSLAGAMQRIGVAVVPTALSFLLPIGISFYVFQAIGYTTETYRQRLDAATNWLDTALLLVFFPKLIAGPLVRPAIFLQQLYQTDKRLESGDVQQALSLLMFGLLKKLLVADALGVLADPAFRAAELAGSGAIFPTPLFIQGFYLFAFQIYADFSGYTDIARGSAILLGLQLPENFRTPYFSTSLGDFWNRWHMSLTQWFREYLFFPISRWLLVRTARRMPRLVQACATLTTMALIGLWHGAAWTYVVWGLWHGCLVILESLLRIKPGHGSRLLSGLISFHLVGLGWVLFRSQSFSSAAAFFTGLISFEQMNWLGYAMMPVFLMAIILYFLDILQSGRFRLPHSYNKLATPIGFIAGMLVLAGLMLLNYAHGGDPQPFIYGSF